MTTSFLPPEEPFMVAQLHFENSYVFATQKEHRLPAPSQQPEAKAAPNSLFRNILRISPLNSEIWREIFCKLLIPKDRDMGGGYPC